MITLMSTFIYLQKETAVVVSCNRWSHLAEEADTKHEDGPLSVPALDLPKAVQRRLLPRKHRLGVAVTQSQANPPSPQMESDWGFSSCYLCLHRRESALPRLWAIPPEGWKEPPSFISWKELLQCSLQSCHGDLPLCFTRKSHPSPVVSVGCNVGDHSQQGSAAQPCIPISFREVRTKRRGTDYLYFMLVDSLTLYLQSLPYCCCHTQKDETEVLSFGALNELCVHPGNVHTAACRTNMSPL
ncbi:hypothetical protein Q8A67_021448 [Cirrhinus molitorella]|uniref:Uncharacterized protein n=1 Tax=Cirrhinus molitorella TaxID=172907 RepID=A0AA88PAR2_9TELE|nr:hypothetical protein Q8A67_021448 [Cirrhinus molitorella]